VVDAGPGRLAVATMTAAELWVGVLLSARPAENRRVVDGFLARLALLDFDVAGAAAYTAIRVYLQRAGLMIGERDLIIAAVGLSRGLTVITAKMREFARVPGLEVEDWGA
jgi:tRNA(fMet)-specific endonuclease VapC